MERTENLIMQEDSIRALKDLEYRKKLYEEFGL